MILNALLALEKVITKNKLPLEGFLKQLVQSILIHFLITGSKIICIYLYLHKELIIMFI